MIPEDVEKRLFKKAKKNLARKNKERIAFEERKTEVPPFNSQVRSLLWLALQART
jgi:hypothetical protein